MKILPTAKALTWARKWWFNSILPDWDAHSNLYKKESANSYFTRPVAFGAYSKTYPSRGEKCATKILITERKTS